MNLKIFIDSFKNKSIDSFEDFLVDQDRQFQKFLFVIDSFGQNRCGKYGLKSFGILCFSPHTHLSLLLLKAQCELMIFFKIA